MYKILSVVAILTFFCNQTQGQTDTLRSIELRDLYWKNNLEVFNSTETPQEWEEESAIILAKQTKYWVKKVPIVSVLEERFHTHKRIKILDDHALQKYSEFSFGDIENQQHNTFFSSNSIHFYYGIKLVKPDGSEEIIDESEMIREEVGQRRNTIGNNKIAVPNLEKGDILDYYYCMERRFSMNVFYVFDPVRYFLNDVYPIVHQELTIDMARKCFLNCKSINGAPKIVELETSENKVNSYQITDSNRAKMKIQEWEYPYAELPCVKFQVFNPGPPLTVKPDYSLFWGEKLKIKSEINPEGLYHLAKNLKATSIGSYYKALNKYTKSKYKKGKVIDKQEFVNDAYFFLREFWTRQRFFIKPQVLYYTQTASLSNMIGALSRLLHNYNIKHHILYLYPSYYGEDEDLLFMNELQPALFVENFDQPIFITSLSYTSTPERIANYLQGVNAYAAPMYVEFPQIERKKIPSIEIDNLSEIQSKLTLNKEEGKVEIESEFVISGSAKQDWDTTVINNRVLYEEFRYTEYAKFIKDRDQGRKPDVTKTFAEKIRNALKEGDELRIKNCEKQLQAYFGLQNCKVVKFELISSGRWLDQKQLKFKIKWETSDLLTMAGDEIFLNVSKLVKEAIDTELLEEERNSDIHLSSENNLRHHIELLVPDQYQISGLDNLKSHFEDDLFKLSCTVDINKLVLEQQIKQKDISVSKWNDLKSFFNKCSSFSKKQLLLTKNMN